MWGADTCGRGLPIAIDELQYMIMILPWKIGLKEDECGKKKSIKNSNTREREREGEGEGEDDGGKRGGEEGGG